MGLRVLFSEKENRAVAYDSVTGAAVGTVIDDGGLFSSAETALLALLDHIDPLDVRRMNAEEFESAWSDLKREVEAMTREDRPTLFCQVRLEAFRERRESAPIKVRENGHVVRGRDGAEVFVESRADGSRVLGKIVATHHYSAPRSHTVTEVRADWAFYVAGAR